MSDGLKRGSCGLTLGSNPKCGPCLKWNELYNPAAEVFCCEGMQLYDACSASCDCDECSEPDAPGD